MKISERIEATIESWRIKWGDILKGWMASWFEWGLERLFDAFEPDIRSEITPQLNKLKEIPNLPLDMKDILDKATEAHSFVQFAALAPYLIGAFFGLAMGSVAPISRWGSYPIDKMIHSYRLDPGSVITAWRRDKPKYEKLLDDLKEQGWSDDRIEALKFFTLYMPSAAEIVHWYAREVYEPDMIRRYGLDSELPEYEKTDFPKIGVDPIQAKNHWMAHWEHASYMQIREMIHRGVLSLAKDMPEPPTTKSGWEARDAEGAKAAYDWYRLVEIPPFWRERLTEMMFEVPTRVDVRRFWDMRTINEERLRSIYHSQGYHGKDLDDYVLWTKVYTAFPDLIARYKHGWLSEEEAKRELAATGLEEPRLTELWETKFKKELPDGVDETKKLNESVIIKAFKDEKIGRDECIDLLMRDRNYSYEDAEFVVDVKVASLGSPETYLEFKQIIEKHRKGRGLEAKIPPTELIEAEKDYKEAKRAEAEAREKGLKEARLDPYLKAVSDAEYAYRQLLIKWKETK